MKFVRSQKLKELTQCNTKQMFCKHFFGKSLTCGLEMASA